MSRALVSGSLLVASGLFSSLAVARTYFVGPDGAGTACTRPEPCALGTGAELAVAGDTVILLDGTYHEPLHPANSGTPEAWITFRADDCALPILEGPGEGILDYEAGEAPSGVASSTGTYLRFVGIVSRHWDSGFTNGWTGQGTTNSNGHFEYIHCIGDGNGRTGMVLYSAGGITIRESISAHNGGNPMGSWSSGVQLYSVLGSPEDNIVERTVSFENTDAERNTDGSGFIVDEYTEGATFTNNIAFGNGGSCFRFTRSSNTRISHFSCYHNGMNPLATGPTNPGEFFFTDEYSRSTMTLSNTLAAASGSTADPSAFVYHPEPEFPLDMGLFNNLTVDSGPTPFYSAPDADHPDFRPPTSAAAQVENLGSVDAAAAVDIGFDPKCIVKRDPQVPFQQSWWSYAIDYDYIRSIGGVAKCFHPKPRSGGADIGAYELSGEPHAFSQPGSCVRGPDPVDPVSPEPAVVPTGVGPAPASTVPATAVPDGAPSSVPAGPSVPTAPTVGPVAAPGSSTSATAPSATPTVATVGSTPMGAGGAGALAPLAMPTLTPSPSAAGAEGCSFALPAARQRPQAWLLMALGSAVAAVARRLVARERRASGV